MNSAPLITSLVTAAVSLIGVFRGESRLRAQLKADASIAATLPPGSTRERLLRHIDERVTALIDGETKKTRDYPMLAVSLILAPSLAYLTVWLVQRGTWWGYVCAVVCGVFALLFIYGIFETATKAERDAKGIRVEHKPASQ